MNNCKKHNGKIKLGGYKGGRGYCGYHTTHFGREVYLRSLQEYIYAKYLDTLGVYYLTENIVYEIDGQKYKPDFFVYEDDFKKLTKIVEIKYTNDEQSDYQKKFSKYFELHGIEYNVLSRYNVKQLIRNEVITKNEIEKWKNNFVKNYSKFDYSGEKNPMYGIKHSEKTKKKIGKRTREYFKDEEVIRRHKIGRDKFWKSDDGKKLKEQYADLRHKESEINNPKMECICKFCGEKYEKKLKDRFHKETCSNSCQQKYNWKVGKMRYKGGADKTYRSKIKKYFRILLNNHYNLTNPNYDFIIQDAKSYGTIPRHFGMGLDIVKKYFGSLTNLKKEIR